MAKFDYEHGRVQLSARASQSLNHQCTASQFTDAINHTPIVLVSLRRNRRVLLCPAFSEAGHTKLPLSFRPVRTSVRPSVRNLLSATPHKLSIGLL